MKVHTLKNADVGKVFEGFSSTLERDGDVYVSRRETPFILQTPPLETTDIELPSGEYADFTDLRPAKPALLDFMKVVEAQALALAVSNKAAWFREDLPDDVIVSSFKSFLQGSTVRVRVSESLGVYDAEKNVVPTPEPGTLVKAVLELSRITFGKTQFGLVWTLRQIKLAESYIFEPDSPPEPEPEPDSILAAGISDGIADGISGGIADGIA